MIHQRPLKQAKEYMEGRTAASNGLRFSLDCPYLFHKTGLEHTPEGRRKFNSEYRFRLEAWFEGWRDWLYEHQLNFKFKPR